MESEDVHSRNNSANKAKKRFFFHIKATDGDENPLRYSYFKSNANFHKKEDFYFYDSIHFNSILFAES